MASEARSPTPASVLFACSRNAVRSPMAAAIARHYVGRHITVESAGVEAGELDSFAIAVMAELGIDIGKYRPKTLEVVSEVSFDLVVTLSPEAHHRALGMRSAQNARVEYWQVQDPTLAIELGLSRERILDAYREVRDVLSTRILARLKEGSAGSL